MTIKKTALVTGGNRGIGLEVCRQLLEQDIKVILGSRDIEKGLKAKEKLDSDHVELLQLDVTSDQQLQTVADRLASNEFEIDILVNNAGISQGIRHTILNEPDDISRRAMETNFWGAWRLSRIVIPYMMKADFGRIVNVSSGHGSFTKLDRQNPGYRFSKVTLNALTVMLSDEVKDYNILVNTMTPGWVRTRLGGVKAERNVAKGAETATWLCLLADSGPRGCFFKDKEIFPW